MLFFLGSYLPFCFNTQPPEGGWADGAIPRVRETVSTHSRLKAAGYSRLYEVWRGACFNTQPPEGGWAYLRNQSRRQSSFNTQPPEGGW